MILGTIILVLLVGFILMLLEVFVVPGTTLVGMLGLALVAGGIYWSFSALGNTAGLIILGSSLLISLAVLFYGMKAKVWEKFMLHTNMEGKIESVLESLHVGDRGISISRIAPIGKAKFGKIEIEVQSIEGYIDERVEIEIESIKHNQVYVRKTIYAA